MKTKNLILCALFAALMCIGAVFTIPIPFTPIPITLQIMVICITGAVLKEKYAVISVIIYIFMGFIGLPVYSGMKSGPQVIFGATGGYILGFIPAVFVIGVLTSKFVDLHKKDFDIFFKLMLFMILGLLIIYALGTVQFMFVTKNNFLSALMAAVIPFIPLDLIKIFFACVVSHFILKNIKQIILF